MARPVENDMVEYGNSKSFPGRDKLPGNLQVFSAGIEIAGRMIVGKDNRRCPVGFRVGNAAGTGFIVTRLSNKIPYFSDYMHVRKNITSIVETSITMHRSATVIPAGR